MFKEIQKSRKSKVFGIITIAALTFGIGSNVFAGSSYTTIKAVSDGEDGPTAYMSKGSVSMSGANYDTSNNSLWVELYRNVTGPDVRVGGKELNIESSSSWSHENGSSGNYYVHLDPDGPYYTGCNGWGQAVR
ncbi:hypothetical protein V7024_16295 [Bacillus sp. JJ864]|uniref:hypothetical protein n=1 Tax=Bacillus sp. JJ864 TaxID=3122975 RepID=UPI002FFF45DE